MEEEEFPQEVREPTAADLRELQFEWKGLVAHKGWHRLVDAIEGQIDRRVGQLIRQADLPERDFMRGEAGGMDFMKNLPDVEIARLEEEITERARFEELVEEERNGS